jgi:hypothetical protein
VAAERSSLAVVLAHLAEADARKLYLRAGYDSMYAFCIHELRMYEDTSERIRVARTARHFPVIFEAIADGRLDLTGVRLLAHHLTAENVDEVLAAAAHRPQAEVEEWLERRFPESKLEPDPGHP